MALLQNVIAKGTHAARPAAGSAGILYYETDVYKLFRDNGSSWDEIDLTAAVITQGQLAQAQGGTGKDTSGATNGQLLIGKTSDNSLNLATLTAGSGITVTNGAGSVTLAATGSSGALTQISDQTLGSDTATVSFASIAGTYSHLKLVVQARATNAATEGVVNIKINSDTGSNYDTQYVATFNNSTSGGQQIGVATAALAAISAANSTTGNASSFETLIPNYANTTFHKCWQTINFELNDQASTGLVVANRGGHWRSTSAITQIDLALTSGNFKTGSRFTLYGLT